MAMLGCRLRIQRKHDERSLLAHFASRLSEWGTGWTRRSTWCKGHVHVLPGRPMWSIQPDRCPKIQGLPGTEDASPPFEIRLFGGPWHAKLNLHPIAECRIQYREFCESEAGKSGVGLIKISRSTAVRACVPACSLRVHVDHPTTRGLKLNHVHFALEDPWHIQYKKTGRDRGPNLEPTLTEQPQQERLKHRANPHRHDMSSRGRRWFCR